MLPQDIKVIIVWNKLLVLKDTNFKDMGDLKFRGVSEPKLIRTPTVKYSEPNTPVFKILGSNNLFNDVQE